MSKSYEVSIIVYRDGDIVDEGTFEDDEARAVASDAARWLNNFAANEPDEVQP